MAFECIKGNYNFDVSVGDSKNILYTDMSDWMSGDHYGSPEIYLVDITLPGGTKIEKVELGVTFGNAISTSKLGITKFRDGIYCFETFSCGKSYKRQALLLPYLGCCLRRARITLSEDKQEQLDEIERLLKLTAYNVELQMMEVATNTLEIARKMFENLKCDCECS